MNSVSRRGWMGMVGTGAAVASAAGLAGNIAKASELKGSMAKEAGGIGPYTLPPLPFKPDALEPYLDAETVTIHHDKHHAGYVKGLNTAIEMIDAARNSGDYGSIQALCRSLSFNCSGHVLHSLYWDNLSPDPDAPKGAFKKAVDEQFGSVDKMKAQLSAATAKVAGSGWGILGYEPLGKRLLVLQLEKHENQLIPAIEPLLVIDVWEHAYYLKYQNKRGDYISALWNVINWPEVGKRYEAAA